VSKIAITHQLIPQESTSNDQSLPVKNTRSTSLIDPKTGEPAINTRYPAAATLSERLTQAQLRLYHSKLLEPNCADGSILEEESGARRRVSWTPQPQQAIYELKDLKKNYDTVSKQWKDSACEEVLSAKLEQELGAMSLVSLRKGICVGLGSPSADPSGWRRCVMWQIVAFKSIVEIGGFT